MGFEDQPLGFFNAGRGEDRMYRETVYRLDQFLTSLGYIEGEPTIELPKDRAQIRTVETR